MKILMESIKTIQETDPNTILSNLKDEIDDSLKIMNSHLYSEIISGNILRIYYDNKSLCSIQIEIEDDVKNFILQDYTGNIQLSKDFDIVDKLENMILNLNFYKSQVEQLEEQEFVNFIW